MVRLDLQTAYWDALYLNRRGLAVIHSALTVAMVRTVPWLERPLDAPKRASDWTAMPAHRRTSVRLGSHVLELEKVLPYATGFVIRGYLAGLGMPARSQ